MATEPQSQSQLQPQQQAQPQAQPQTSQSQESNNTTNASTVKTEGKIQWITKQVPFWQPTNRSVQYLSQLVLSQGCMHNELEFKQLVSHLVQTIVKHPSNTSLVLNLQLPLPMHRSIVLDKLKKLDHILGVVTQTPEPTHQQLQQRWKHCSYKDIVAHYTRYEYITKNETHSTVMESSEERNVNNNEDKTEEQSMGGGTSASARMSSLSSYVRSNVLGMNSNYQQFLQSIKDHLANDNKYFLTTSVPKVDNRDMDLLLCRFYCICEGLTTLEFGNELIVDESKCFKDVLNYFYQFIHYCLVMHERQHMDFSGLSSDHLKLLVAGVVLLEIGMKTPRNVMRLVLNINNETKELLETPLELNGKPSFDYDKVRHIFALERRVVDTTPSTRDDIYRKDLENAFKPMYQSLIQFFLANPSNQ